MPPNAGDTGSIPGTEDSTFHRAARPMCHNYGSPHTLRACALQQEKYSHEKPAHSNNE